MESPILSAIVLNYRTPKEAIRCVRALQRQTIADRMEILLIDNHSEDDSIQFLRNTFNHHSFESSPKIFETRTNLGYGQGNALGVRRARGKYILIINPDNELEPEGAEKLIEVMERDPGIGILAPKLVHEDRSVRDSFRAFPTLIDVFIKRTFLRHIFRRRLDRYVQTQADHEQVRDVDWIAGACLLLRRDFYEELGGFDPRFFLFFEDIDLCRRCWAAGKRVVYFPLVHATDRKHRLSQGSTLALFTNWTVREHLRSAVKYFWKWK